MIELLFKEAQQIIRSIHKRSQQSVDAELASPDIKVEPADSYINKAVQLLKSINPNYFVGVRKIVVDMGSGFGYVESGPGKDPAVIHINLSRVKNELKGKLPNATQEQLDKEMVRQIATTISHEKGHVSSFKSESGFVGAEAPAEAEEQQMGSKIDANPGL
jgi:hypothetical protein